MLLPTVRVLLNFFNQSSFYEVLKGEIRPYPARSTPTTAILVWKWPWNNSDQVNWYHYQMHSGLNFSKNVTSDVKFYKGHDRALKQQKNPYLYTDCFEHEV